MRFFDSKGGFIKMKIYLRVSPCILILFFIISLKTELYSNNMSDMVKITASYGYGLSSGKASGLSGSDLSVYGNNPSTTDYNNSNAESSTAYNFGAGFDIGVIKILSVYTGLFYEHKPFKVIYPKNTAASDAEFLWTISY